MRRWYLRQRRYAESLGEPGVASTLQYQQEHEPGTALPVLSAAVVEKLAAAGYKAREDLYGADEDELVTEASLSRAEARGVLRALE